MARIGLLLLMIAAVPLADVELAAAQPPGLPPGVQGGATSGPIPVGPSGLPLRDNSARRTGTARLRGRVVAADTGQPIRRATVRATSPDIRESVSTLTDTDGTFDIKELAAGRYTLTATKGAYATLAYGQTRPNEPGRQVELADNQTLDHLDFRLPRGAVVTGTIVDEFGDPVPDALVTAYRTQFAGGRQRLLPAGRPMTTDDIGNYRVFGLPPGSYFISATVRTMGPTGPQERSDSRSGYAPTYFPGTADIAAAQRVTLRAGQTATAINLALVAAPTAVISGTVISPSGERPGNGMVMVFPKGMLASPMFSTTPGMIRPDGSFSIANVPPGEYVLTAMVATAPGVMPTPARATVVVNGQDISGVQLTPAVPSRVSGRVTLDGGARTSLGSPLQLMVLPVDLDTFAPGPGGMSPPTRVADDLTFESTTAAERVVVRLNGPQQWALKAVYRDGVEVTDGFDVRAGSDITGLDVELTSQVQEVTGLVTNARGAAVANYTVIVFAQDRGRWTPTTRHISTGRPDQQGRFRVRSLPPGDYYAAALESVEPGAWMDPDLLASLMQDATSLSLNAGETKTLDLRILEGR